MHDALAYYVSQSPLSDAGEHASACDGLPTDIRELCKVVQGVVAHPAGAPAYGRTIEKARHDDLQLRLVRQNLVRDATALDKMEMLPGDGWGLAEGMENTVPPVDGALLDHVAVLTQKNEAFSELRDTYQVDGRLRVPSTMRSNGPGGSRLVPMPVGRS